MNREPHFPSPELLFIGHATMNAHRVRLFMHVIKIKFLLVSELEAKPGSQKS